MRKLSYGAGLALANSALRLLVTIFAGLGIFVGGACNQGKPSNAAAPPPPPPEVFFTSVIQKDVPVYSEWLGTTDGSINAQIRARVQGYLHTRHYREGVFVKAGDLLFSIDPRVYQAALDQAKGDLGRAEAALGKTRLDVARYTPLAKEGAISQQELDNAIQADRGNQASVAARAGGRQASRTQFGMDTSKISDRRDCRDCNSTDWRSD